jgi:NhaA family Na+:H+ antiporter
MRRAAAFVVDNSLLLLAGTLAALAWANADLASYEHFAEPLHFLVNDVGMVFFFALATKEIVEATLPGGALASWREAAIPLLAAAGGMLAPALIYLGWCAAAARPDLAAGWAIPCATDIAFSYLVARLIFPKGHPAIPFLLLLAVADDALGLGILAIFYPARPLALATFALLILPAVGVAWLLRWRRVRSFWPYTLLAGGCSWAALYIGGFHPALGLVPVIPFMPSAPRDLGLFEEHEHLRHDTLDRFEHFWRIPVQIILFFFGLVNAGVPLSSTGTATILVLAALVVGKPTGILLLCVLGVAAGLRMPGGLRYKDALVAGLAAGIGFTVALFFATAAFPHGSAALDEAKMGALLSFVSAPLALIAGRAFGLRTTSRAPAPRRA